MVLAFLLACGPTRKIGQIRQQELAATLALSRNEIEEERKVIAVARRDTLTVQDEGGNTVLIMKAVKDQASGEMVATDVLDAAVITARFRNVAERNGRIDLRFEIIVPALMQDTRWQLRFYPDMFILEDSLRLEPVLITGREYRQQQLRGYQQYEKFLRSIITDSTRFLDYRNLDIFIRRNIPELYALKADSSFVSDEVFHSLYGVTEQAAIAHYTNQFGKSLNERRKSRQDAMYTRYVKVPIVTEGIRLDTVLQNANGDFVYHYTQRIATRPKLRKVDVVLSGEIFESDHRLYTMARSQPLTFYISSLSSFTDGTERYLTRTIERRAAANTACYVDFRSGKWEVEPALGNNREELSRIRENIVQLLSNPTFELDSIVIGASASPEGAQAANDALAKQRAGSVADYFDRFIRSYRDSVQRALNEEARNTFTLTVGDDGKETVGRVKARKADLPAIPFRSRSAGENWDLLSFLVDSDSVGVLEEFLHLGEVVFNSLKSELPVDEVGNVVHRARTVEGVHCNEVLETLRMKSLEPVLHPGGFKLEHAVGVAAAVEFVGRFVVYVDCLYVNVLSETELDVVQALMDDREGVEAQEVHLEHSHILDVVAVVLAGPDKFSGLLVLRQADRDVVRQPSASDYGRAGMHSDLADASFQL